jgi:hypothetical protein
MVSDMPFGSGVIVIESSQAHLVHVSTLSGPQRRCGIRPVAANGWVTDQPHVPGIPLPFGRRH